MHSLARSFAAFVLATAIPSAAAAQPQKRPPRPQQRRAPQAQQPSENQELSEPRVELTVADLETVLPKLTSTNPDEISEAIDLLAVIDHPRCVPPLADLLRSGPTDHISDRALNALKIIAEPDSIEVLTELTNHRRVGARRRAYQALAAIDDRRIRPLLERGLRDSDRGVRGAAALALGSTGAKQSLDLLFRAFERGVIEAAIAVGKLGDDASVERFHGYLGQQPLGVMLSGYNEFLRRDDIAINVKKAIVERLGEVAGIMVRRFLDDYSRTFPETTRNRALQELKTLVETTVRRIPEEAAGTRVNTGGEP